MDLCSPWESRHMRTDLRSDIWHQLVRQTGHGEKEQKKERKRDNFKFLWGLTCQTCDESVSIVNSRWTWKHITQTTANPSSCVLHRLIRLMLSLGGGAVSVSCRVSF